MLDLLRRTDECQVCASIPFLAILGDDFLTFFEQPHHPFAGLRPRRGIKELETLIETLNLALGFGKVRLEQCGQSLVVRSLSHLRQGFHELLLGMQQVPHLVDEQLADRLGIGFAGGF